MKIILALVLSLGFEAMASDVLTNGKQAYELMLAGKAAILDVREKNEVDQGTIKGAHWVALSDLNARPEAVSEKVKSLLNGRKLFVYCRSGSRSAQFLKILKQHQISGENLGGFDSLIEQGLPSQRRP